MADDSERLELAPSIAVAASGSSFEARPRPRGFVSLGVAVGLHGFVALGMHGSRGEGCPVHAAMASDFVILDAIEAAVPRAIEPPPPVAARPRATRPRDDSPSSAPTQAVAATEVAPAASEAPPAPAAPAPETLTTTAPSTFAVAPSAASGNGTNGTANASTIAATSRGSSLGTAAPAIDPDPARRRYRTLIASRVGRPEYTNSMRRRQLEGRVSIGVTIDESGTVVGTRVRSSSGNAELDENALDHVRAFVAAHRRVDPPPVEAAWGTRELALTYAYDFEDL